ncbi:DsbA family protein [Changpingibacter yushuensis]|uniref:DsbA family protein n=1 Tax=Changpingibacter yushuensis TaxID=2758440 RepID=UPI0015F5AFEF|nr:thioredoxin domain-containing protein [Changpingibacter yushuensis]
MASRNTPGTASSNMTKEQRREAAREAAKRLQEEEARRAKRNLAWTITGVVVVLALVLGAVWLIVSSGKDSSADNATSSATGEPAFTDFTFGDSQFTATLPENVDDMGGISVGSDLTAGSVNEGAPEVRIYFDYLCTHCNDLEAQFGEQLTQMAQDGEITLVYNPVAIMGQDFSSQSAAADFFLAANAPEQYIEFHNAVFSELSSAVFDGSADALPTVDQMIGVAKEVGVPDDVVAELQSAVEDGTLDDFVSQATSQFTANGLTGTPSVIVDGQQLTNWNTALTTAISEAVSASGASSDASATATN